MACKSFTVTTPVSFAIVKYVLSLAPLSLVVPILNAPELEFRNQCFSSVPALLSLKYSLGFVLERLSKPRGDAVPIPTLFVK